MSQSIPPFVCKRCNRILEESENRLICSGCHLDVPVRDGVPHFVVDHAYWGEISRGTMRNILTQMSRQYWQDVFRESKISEVMRAFRMISDLNRACWHMLLPLEKDSVILDIGAGTGTISHALSLSYKHVIALEPVLERIRFMKMRFDQERIHNVQLVRASALEIPLPDNSIDLAVLNGVLEWIPLSDVQCEPKEAQMKLLKTINNLLKPNGYLYMGIENRFFYYNFVGANDPHFGMPYVTVLPRVLANFFARMAGKGQYRNYLYSYWGYKKMLERCGFKELQIYVAFPTYNRPDYLVPIKGSEFSFFQENFYPRAARLRSCVPLNLLKFLNLFRYFQYSFVIFGRKK